MNRNGSGNRGSESGMALVRAVVAGYLIYLGVSIVRDRLAGKSAMAPWLAWGCGVLFVTAGAVFGWFTWKRYRAETAEKAAETEKPETAERPEITGPDAPAAAEIPEEPAEKTED